MNQPTVVMAEGRRMMRLSRELMPEVFEALLDEYRRVLHEVLESMGGGEVEVDDDTAVAVFSTAGEAALAAVAAQRAVAVREWSHGRNLAISVGLHSGARERAALRCSELCDAAEGGQIFLTPETGMLLEQEQLGELSVRDLGAMPLRRVDRRVRAYQLAFL